MLRRHDLLYLNGIVVSCHFEVVKTAPEATLLPRLGASLMADGGQQGAYQSNWAYPFEPEEPADHCSQKDGFAIPYQMAAQGRYRQSR
jgi:hypothetical protein